MRSFILLLLLSLSCSLATGQMVLSLQNAKRYQRVYFAPGDLIRFRMTDSRANFRGRILELNDSLMVITSALRLESEGDITQRVSKDYVRLNDIERVYARPSNAYGARFASASAGALLGGGLLYSVLIPLDQLAGGEPFVLRRFLLGPALMGAGMLMRLTIRSHYKVGRRWQLRPMPYFDFGPQTTLVYP